jgi:hypothetical protein
MHLVKFIYLEYEPRERREIGREGGIKEEKIGREKSVCGKSLWCALSFNFCISREVY